MSARIEIDARSRQKRANAKQSAMHGFRLARQAMWLAHFRFGSQDASSRNTARPKMIRLARPQLQFLRSRLSERDPNRFPHKPLVCRQMPY
jgi:hypothetical protein